ncbi:MAG: GAF domain-containing protein [Rhodobacteraceae bacterium]|nr:GAF domain-containing protein [Paracoccaceae bacterium]
MLVAPTPETTERLRALRELGILDTPNEREFDDITAFAARMCNVPVALISFVDLDRQWFKSSTGVNVRETPLSNSICSYALDEEELLEIPDCTKDARSKDNPTVTGAPQFRFYAGAVLRTSDGVAIGTLCVLDHQPRKLSARQRDVLLLLAKQVMKQVELQHALDLQQLLRAEVDHRVKNSLQMVATLLRFQKTSLTTPEARAAMDDAGRRVEAIAALHSELYRGNDVSTVALGTFLIRLAELLRQQLPDHISLDVDIAPAALVTSKASALGMIVSEFVANSTKHAFQDRETGFIGVMGRAVGDVYVLTVEDDGIGMPETRSGSGLGLRIIQISAGQLDAEADTTSTPGMGTRLRLEFAL